MLWPQSFLYFLVIHLRLVSIDLSCFLKVCPNLKTILSLGYMKAPCTQGMKKIKATFSPSSGSEDGQRRLLQHRREGTTSKARLEITARVDTTVPPVFSRPQQR